MRQLLIAISLLAASPALAAQPIPPQAYAPPAPYYAPPAPYYGPPPAPYYAPPSPYYGPQGYGPAPVIPPVLTDPRTADRVGQVAGALTRSLLDVSVGEVEAAVAGRPATRADRRRTLGSEIGDPNIDRRIAHDAAASSRQIQAAGAALSRALPAIMQAVDGATANIERAIGNLPDPTYPRR